MKDVSWGDFLIALIVAPVLVLPVVALVYVVLFIVMRLDSGDYGSWLQVTIIITCVAEGLVTASRYRGPGVAIEHGWAWLLAVAVIVLVPSSLYFGGYTSAESAYSYAMAFLNYVAMAFIVAMLSVFFSTRSRPRDPFDERRMELERSASISMLRK